MSNYRELIEALTYQSATDRLSHRAAHALDELQQQVAEQARTIRSLEDHDALISSEHDELCEAVLDARGERDALAAVIEAVSAHTKSMSDALEHPVEAWHRSTITVILNTAPADLLRDHDAEVWDEGALYMNERSWQRSRVLTANPYREKPGDDR